MSNGNGNQVALKVVGLICGILVPVIAGYFMAMGKVEDKHDSTMGEIAVLKKDVAVINDDLKWSKDTNKRDRERDREDMLQLEREIKEELKIVSRQNEVEKNILQEILSRLKVIEHELKIGREKRK